MCDQANHDNCEIVDELHLEITNLEMTIADLKVEILDDLKHIYKFFTKLTVSNKIEKYEAK